MRSIRTRRALAAAAVAASFLLAACGDSSSDSPSSATADDPGGSDSASSETATTDAASDNTAKSDTASTEPAAGDTTTTAADTTAADTAEAQEGGSIIVGISAPCGIDKQQTSGCNFVIDQVVANLTDQLPSDGSIAPWLAESWEISPDGTVYTFHLKSGVTFSDGEKFDAAAVKANFDNIIELGEQGKSFQAAAYLEGYLGTEVVDQLTAEVSFSTPKAGLLQALAEKPLGLLSPKFIESTTPEDRNANGVVSAGPFVIEEVVQNEKIVLTRREDYQWNSPKDQHQGPAYLESITFQIIPESSVRVGSLTSDAIQVASGLPAYDLEQLKSEGYQVAARASGGLVQGYWINLQDPILADEAVRRAVQVALNRQEIHDTVYDEYSPVPVGLLSDTHPNVEDLSSYLAFDPDKAQEILDAAGWTVGDDGIRSKDGQRLTIRVDLTSSGSSGDPHDLVQQELREVGIDFQINQITSAELTARRQSGEWQLSVTGLTRPDADILVSAFDPDYSTSYRVPYDDELQALLKSQAIELDDAKRHETVTQIQEIILDKAYYFPITQFSQTLTAGEKVHGLAFEAPYWPYFFDTWIEH